MRRLLLALLVVFAPSALPAAPRTEVPLLLAVEGRLLDGADNPVSAALSITFHIFAAADHAPGEVALWTATYDVAVAGGLYAVILGDRTDTRLPSGTELPSSVFNEAGDRWLAIAIGGAAELLPRVRFGSTPYALVASNALQLGGRPAADYALAAHDHDAAYYLRADADGRFALQDGTYTKTEAEGLFAAAGASYPKGEADTRFAAAGASYPKGEADTRFAAAGNYALAGAAYTRTEADARYTPAGAAYAKAESDARYLLAGGSAADLLVLKPGAMPASPAEGTLFHDLATHTLRFFTNGAWQVVSFTPRLVPGFQGDIGPDLSAEGYSQCWGWANDGATPAPGYANVRDRCGAGTSVVFAGYRSGETTLIRHEAKLGKPFLEYLPAVCPVAQATWDNFDLAKTYTFMLSTAGVTCWPLLGLQGNRWADPGRLWEPNWGGLSSAYDGHVLSQAGNNALDQGSLTGDRYFVYIRSEKASAQPWSCKAVRDAGQSRGDGTYTVYPDGTTATTVYCDMSTDGGGWTLVASNAKADATFAGGTGRNADAYQLTASGKNGNPGPDKDYLIGPVFSDLVYGEARIYAKIISSAWIIDLKWPVSSRNQITPRASASFIGTNNRTDWGTGQANFFVLDAVYMDKKANAAYDANANQSTVGGAGVTTSSGDPKDGAYIGHGTTEGSYEGFYTGAAAYDADLYSTWVR